MERIPDSTNNSYRYDTLRMFKHSERGDCSIEIRTILMREEIDIT